MTLSDIIARILLTLRDARAGAEWVLSHQIPVRACWQILFLVLVGGTGVAVLAEVLGLAPPSVVFGEQGESATFWLGAINAGVLISAAWLVYVIGRRVGGTGDLAGSVLLVAWFQTILIFLQIVQYLTYVIFPPLAGLIGLLGMVLMGWLPTNFIAVLHGFKSRIAVFLALMAVSFILLVFVSLILRAMGVNLAMGPMA